MHLDSAAAAKVVPEREFGKENKYLLKCIGIQKPKFFCLFSRDRIQTHKIRIKRSEGTKKLRRHEERGVKVENRGVWGLIVTEIKIESGWRWCLDEGRPLTSQAPHSLAQQGPRSGRGQTTKPSGCRVCCTFSLGGGLQILRGVLLALQTIDSYWVKTVFSLFAISLFKCFDLHS